METVMDNATARFWRILPRLACLALAAGALAGCVVVPVPYHPYHPGYAYYR
jgi:hypothetical protein